MKTTSSGPAWATSRALSGKKKKEGRGRGEGQKKEEGKKEGGNLGELNSCLDDSMFLPDLSGSGTVPSTLTRKGGSDN